MKRWHQDYPIALREWQKHRRDHAESSESRSGTRIGVDPYLVDCECDEQIGRFRKKDAHDCGNTHCYLCHPDKFPKRNLTKQELNFNISFKEQIKEF